MKHIFILLISFVAFGLNAQMATNNVSKLADSGKRITITATAGTGYYHGNFSDLKHLSLGELSVQYRTGKRFSLGLGMLGSFICDKTVLDPEGNPTEYEPDHHNGHDPHEPDDVNDVSDDMDDPDDIDDYDHCDDDFGENIMGILTYRLSDQVPFFVRAAAGYSFNSRSPAYSFMFGYNQKLFGGLALTAGIRYNDIISLSSTPNFVSPVGGVKGELGLSLSF